MSDGSEFKIKIEDRKVRLIFHRNLMGLSYMLFYQVKDHKTPPCSPSPIWGLGRNHCQNGCSCEVSGMRPKVEIKPETKDRNGKS